MKSAAFALLLVMALAADFSKADSKTPSNWSEIQSLYSSGKFEEAFEALQKQSDGRDAHYFYDLGTLAYRLGRLGPAIGYLEKADHLKRHDLDILHNLELVRGELSRTVGADQLDPASTWMESMADHLSIDEVRGALGLIAAIVALFWLRAYLKSRDLRRTFLNPAALIGSVALAIVIGLYGAERTAAAHAPAICMDREVIRSGPGDRFVQLGQLEAGTKIRLLGPTAPPDGASPPNPDDWYQVRYSADGIGWIQSSGVLVLN